MQEARIESFQVDATRVIVKARIDKTVFFMSMFSQEGFTIEASARARFG